MFAVVSVCRPGPNVSRALPSRKNSAHWFSLTTSCAPSLSSPPPENRQTISRPEPSFHSMTSIAMVRPPRRSEVRGLLQDLAPARDLQLERRRALLDVREVRCRHGADALRQRDDLPDERGIVRVDGRELGLADLHLVEDAAVAVIRVPETGRGLLERAVETADHVE